MGLFLTDTHVEFPLRIVGFAGIFVERVVDFYQPLSIIITSKNPRGICLFKRGVDKFVKFQIRGR